MKVYKFIGFDKSYWSEPGIRRKLFFANLSQLRSVNDLQEFEHQWSSSTWFGQLLKKHFEQAYVDVFNNARVLCLSTHFAGTCWQKFCPNGGVCYEFEFSDNARSRNLTCGKICYVDRKITSVPEYYFSRILDNKIRRIAGLADPNDQEKEYLFRWLNERKGERDILLAHIKDELTFKKFRNYKDEYEFRFVHVQNPIGNAQLVTKLQGSELEFSELGLNLTRIWTTELEQTRMKIPMYSSQMKVKNRK